MSLAFKIEKLAEHWLFAMQCDHETKTDRANCNCGWAGEWQPCVGDAAEEWAAHALLAIEQAETRQEKQLPSCPSCHQRISNPGCKDAWHKSPEGRGEYMEGR